VLGFLDSLVLLLSTSLLYGPLLSYSLSGSPELCPFVPAFFLVYWIFYSLWIWIWTGFRGRLGWILKSSSSLLVPHLLTMLLLSPLLHVYGVDFSGFKGFYLLLCLGFFLFTTGMVVHRICSVLHMGRGRFLVLFLLPLVVGVLLLHFASLSLSLQGASALDIFKLLAE